MQGPTAYQMVQSWRSSPLPLFVYCSCDPAAGGGGGGALRFLGAVVDAYAVEGCGLVKACPL